ncbi:MAG: hypothetical protein NDI61_06345 [Bdellovibrionaceae bacterium]|nr:hypothetical protein [Pseudobdellovibrionaceae bacterium]
MSKFFIIVPPGLEEIAAVELRLWLREWGVEFDGTQSPQPVLQRHRGGLELELPLELGFALNHVLKTASRILVRVEDFGCRDFPKLFRKSRAFPWNDWSFPQAPSPAVSASSHRSRLRLKKRIEETCVEGFRAWRKAHGGPVDEFREPKPSLFVRLEDDICTFSMDTSGEHLHKRGYRTDVPEAPLRETIAAALVLKLLEGADAQREWTLVDPMAGSGTLLLEAAGLGNRLKRAYAYRDFAMVRERRVSVRPVEQMGRPVQLPRFSQLLGVDRSADALRAARANAERGAGDVNPEFLEGDLVAAQEPEFSSQLPQNGAVICNPPYGERLKIEGSLTGYYSRLIAAIESRLAPERVGLLLPAKADAQRIAWPRAWRPVSATRFSNGGIPVIFHVCERILDRSGGKN